MNELDEGDKVLKVLPHECHSTLIKIIGCAFAGTKALAPPSLAARVSALTSAAAMTVGASGSVPGTFSAGTTFDTLAFTSLT